MAAFSRDIRCLFRMQGPAAVCTQCFLFSTSSAVRSGHNRWSKIKHDKGNADAKKTAQRSALAKEISDASKLYGGDPAVNPRLAAVISTAKKAGFPKASIEAAIARGQGVSTSGAALEALTLEVLLDSSVALVIDILSDNRSRTLSDLRFLIKTHGGTVTPTNYLFQKRGKVLFDNSEKRLSIDKVLDEAIEAEAEDVDTDEDGNIIVWTKPSSVTATAKKLSKILGIKVKASDIIWDPKEDTLAPLRSEEAANTLSQLIDALHDNPNVHGVYLNVIQGNIDDKLWSEIKEKIVV